MVVDADAEENDHERTWCDREATYTLAMRETSNLTSVSDEELLRSLSDVLKQSRRVEADLVAHIAEVDGRRLYAREAAPSMHAYCIDVLHLSEPETALRIHVARASRAHPVLLEMLRDGRIHLSGIALLVPHLTAQSRRGLLKRATHKTRRQIEEIVAELRPRPDVPAAMRKLPAPRSEGTRRGAPQVPPGPATETTANGRLDEVEPANSLNCEALAREHRLNDVEQVNSLNSSALEHAGLPGDARPALEKRAPATVEPLAPARYQVKFTASQELHDKLERLQALMRSSVPDGDLGVLIEAAVTEKLERLEAKRLGKTKSPRKTLAETDTAPTSRHVPGPVRRAVWERDEGRCTFVDARGRRCQARDRLEFHHHGTPYGRGGDHSPVAVRIMCRTHNQLQAELDYGKEKMAQYRRQRTGDGVSERVAVYAARSLSHSP